QRAAHAELARLALDHARALRKDDDPEAVREPRLALVDDLVDGAVAFAAVDRDGPQHLETPAHEGHPHQLALQHPHLRWNYEERRDGLPGRGVVAHHDVIAGWDVLAALHHIREAAQACEHP